jgi:DNA-binding NtrC family response regulator
MKRILFVDDEQNVLDGFRRMLHDARDRWEMEFVTSGEAALLAFKQRGFDVVVSDLRMPGMDGAELLGHVRDQFPGTAGIILSGYADLALSARAAAVACRVLAKPCDPEEFKAAIEGLCSRQEVLRGSSRRGVIDSPPELNR